MCVLYLLVYHAKPIWLKFLMEVDYTLHGHLSRKNSWFSRVLMKTRYSRGRSRITAQRNNIIECTSDKENKIIDKTLQDIFFPICGLKASKNELMHLKK